MGRPDLSHIRREQILDAFGRCVARYGLHGSSLELVASEAGMKRSVLRHYMGNRDDMIVALAERVAASSRAVLVEFANSPGAGQVDVLLDFLLAPASQNTDDLLTVEALIAAGEDHPRVRTLMTDYIGDVVSMCADHLQLAYPDAPRDACSVAAHGIVGIAFNHAAFAPLSLPEEYLNAAYAAARALAATLD